MDVKRIEAVKTKIPFLLVIINLIMLFFNMEWTLLLG